MQNKTSLKFLYFLTVITITLPFLAWPEDGGSPLKLSQMGLNKRLQEEIGKDYFHIKSDIKNLEENKQQLDYLIVGLHPQSCDTALPRLSLYEKYRDYLGFVKESQYFEANKMISLQLGHSLLPFEMILRFRLPRLSKPGIYNFSFQEGFLKGLMGEIHVSNHANRCLFITKAAWTGPHSGIAPSLFSFFSTTLSRMAMEGLFRASTQN